MTDDSSFPAVSLDAINHGTDRLIADVVGPILRVVQSECRTGWMVVDGVGRVVSPVFRSREQAVSDAEWLRDHQES